MPQVQTDYFSTWGGRVYQNSCSFQNHVTFLQQSSVIVEKKEGRLWARLETFVNQMADASLKKQVLSIMLTAILLFNNVSARLISPIEKRENNVIVLDKTTIHSTLYLTLLTGTSKLQRSCKAAASSLITRTHCHTTYYLLNNWNMSSRFLSDDSWRGRSPSQLWRIEIESE